jgi:hypothetical protein
VEHLQNAVPTVQTLPHVIFEHFQHELPAQKFSANAEVKPATATKTSIRVHITMSKLIIINVPFTSFGTSIINV